MHNDVQHIAQESATQNKKNMSNYFDPDKVAMRFNCWEWGHVGSNCPKMLCTVRALGTSQDCIISGLVDGDVETESS